jgi:hypothetical protein
LNFPRFLFLYFLLLRLRELRECALRLEIEEVLKETPDKDLDLRLNPKVDPWKSVP